MSEYNLKILNISSMEKLSSTPNNNGFGFMKTRGEPQEATKRPPLGTTPKPKLTEQEKENQKIVKLMMKQYKDEERQKRRSVAKEQRANRKEEKEHAKEEKKKAKRAASEAKQQAGKYAGLSQEEIDAIKAQKKEERRIKAEKLQQQLEKESKAGTKMLYELPVAEHADSVTFVKFEEYDNKDGTSLKQESENGVFRKETSGQRYHVIIQSRDYIFDQQYTGIFINGDQKSGGVRHFAQKPNGESRKLDELDTIDGVKVDQSQLGKIVFTFAGGKVETVKAK